MHNWHSISVYLDLDLDVMFDGHRLLNLSFSFAALSLIDCSSIKRTTIQPRPTAGDHSIEIHIHISLTMMIVHWTILPNLSIRRLYIHILCHRLILRVGIEIVQPPQPPLWIARVHTTQRFTSTFTSITKRNPRQPWPPTGVSST